MTSPLRTDVPRIVHRLAFALRFHDAFSVAGNRLLVNVPLDVTIPLPTGVAPPAQIRPPQGPIPGPIPPVLETLWRARRSEQDGTYRFLLTNQMLVPGNYTVTVTAPGGEYRNLEPIVIAVPVPRTPPPAPPALRSDFLFARPLWPTRRSRFDAGSTVVIGSVVHAGGTPAVGYTVRLFPAGPVPPNPYTITDQSGDFVYRFPLLARAPGAPPLALHDFEVRDPLNAVVPVASPPAGTLPVTIGTTTVGVRLTVP